jgi:hypothetical protein
MFMVLWSLVVLVSASKSISGAAVKSSGTSLPVLLVICVVVVAGNRDEVENGDAMVDVRLGSRAGARRRN